MKISNPVVPTLKIHPAILVKRKPTDPDELKLWTPPSAKHISARFVQFIVEENEKYEGKVILVQPGCFFQTDMADTHIWFMWERDVLAVLTPDEDEEIKLTNGEGKFLEEADNVLEEAELKKAFDKQLADAVKIDDTRVDKPTIIIKGSGGIVQ